MSTTTSVSPTTVSILPWLALGAGLLALVLVFLPECQAAVRVWIDSTAYGHCFLVAPIAAFLAWDRRDSVRGMLPRPAPALLLLGLPLPLAWFAADRLGIMEGRQLVALAFAELLFLTVMGWALFRAMMGPLLYLVFLVPFGAFVTPALQGFTAHFIDAGLNVLGIAHYSDDMYIEISAGTFFVAEACAGLRFLIASVAFGVFYALLNYRSPGRRALFIGASIAVPIVANGIRALGIVVLGQILGSAEAAAADHIIYGWVFFSAVMLLLVVAGMPLREAPAPRPASRLPGTASRAAPRPWPALLVPLLASVAPAAALALDRGVIPPTLTTPLAITAPAGCEASSATAASPDRAAALVRCGPRTWRVTLQALPTRSTGAAVSDARNALAGDIDAETTTVKPLAGVPPANGPWQAIVSQNPPRVLAYSVWVHGAPARGGLAQRIQQARDSVIGTPIPPALLVAALVPSGPLGERETTAAVAELSRIVAAQPDLAATIAAVTGSSSPPPPR